MSVASLAMYDHPAQHHANAMLWNGIAGHLRARGVDAPDTLDQRPVEVAWHDPDLLLAHACGLPLVADRGLNLTVVAVPSYAVAGCHAGRHLSRIIVRLDDPAVRLDDLHGRIAAVNAPLSNTGANLLRATLHDGAVAAATITG